jgi:hypothetical protein
MFSLEAPVKSAAECCIVSEAKIALQVEVPIVVLPVEVPAGIGNPNVRLQLPLVVVVFLVLRNARTREHAHEDAHNAQPQPAWLQHDIVPLGKVGVTASTVRFSVTG